MRPPASKRCATAGGSREPAGPGARALCGDRARPGSIGGHGGRGVGARAAERFEAEESRAYFQRAIAAARPQERMQIRRMADASLALAERRAGDLKEAVQRLGQAPPTGRQMFALRAMGLLLPPASAGLLKRVRGILLIIALIVALLALGLGIVELIALPFGGIGIAPGVLLGFFLVAAVITVLVLFGRRRRARAKAR